MPLLCSSLPGQAVWHQPGERRCSGRHGCLWPGPHRWATVPGALRPQAGASWHSWHSWHSTGLCSAAYCRCGAIPCRLPCRLLSATAAYPPLLQWWLRGRARPTPSTGCPARVSGCAALPPCLPAACLLPARLAFHCSILSSTAHVLTHAYPGTALRTALQLQAESFCLPTASVLCRGGGGGLPGAPGPGGCLGAPSHDGRSIHSEQHQLRGELAAAWNIPCRLA